MNRLAFASTLALTLAVTAQAQAWEVPMFDLKVGLRGGPNISLLLEPGDSDDNPGVPYTTYYGTGWNIGPNLTFRALDIVSLEIGYARSVENVNGTIELAGVVVDGEKQEIDQRFSHVAHHIPLILRGQLPMGVARPFLALGIDFVLSHSNRSYEWQERDPIPTETSDPYYGIWHANPIYQAVAGAELSGEPDAYAGFLVGLGLNISVDKIEVPIEMRFQLYPGTGKTVSDRGEFTPIYDASAPPQYDDTFSMQTFILFGLDYVIF